MHLGCYKWISQKITFIGFMIIFIIQNCIKLYLNTYRNKKITQNMFDEFQLFTMRR